MSYPYWIHILRGIHPYLGVLVCRLPVRACSVTPIQKGRLGGDLIPFWIGVTEHALKDVAYSCSAHLIW
jgi:hypothetical protein